MLFIKTYLNLIPGMFETFHQIPSRTMYNNVLRINLIFTSLLVSLHELVPKYGKGCSLFENVTCNYETDIHFSGGVDYDAEGSVKVYCEEEKLICLNCNGLKRK